MKKLLYLLFLPFLFLVGCNDSSGQPMDLVALPIILFLISLVLLVVAVKRRDSGTEWNDPRTGNQHQTQKKLPIWKIWQGVWGLALFVISIAIYFYMRGGWD